MRIGNFTIEAHPEIECYMTVLQGAAGGVEANLNRWRGQMGRPELDAAAIAALPKVEMLATPSPLIEISGSYTTMTGKLYEHYMMMAVVCALPDKTLFVKMTGPEADVQAQKENFAAFCKSIKEGEAPIDAGSKENQ